MLQEIEEELVRSAQNGNINAFERLLRAYERQLLAVASGFAHTPDDANDIYQDAMLAAYRALPNFKLEAKFSTWLHKIVVNTALSYRRKLSRTWRKMSAVENEYEVNEQYVDGHTPEHSTLNTELAKELDAAMKSLSDSERMVFVLCHQQGFKIREAAELMSSSENSLKVMLFRARGKLREQLSEYI